MEQNKMVLVLGNQMVFKKYARKLLSSKCKFYFDNTYCVDEKTSENIPNVSCDGTLTFEKAVKRLEKYFSNKLKLEDKAKKEAKKEKAKAKKAEAKAKKEAKKAKELERKKAKKEAKKAKRDAKKAKELAKREKERAKKIALKEKMKLAKEKARAKEKAKKNQVKQVAKKPNGHLEVSIEMDAQEASKLMKNVLIKTANELASLNDKKREKKIKKLEKAGYYVMVEGHTLTITFDGAASITNENTINPGTKDEVEPEVVKEVVKPDVVDTTEDNETSQVEIASEVDSGEVAIPDDGIVSGETEAVNENDEFLDELEEDYRFDNEADDDKVDFRREFFNDENAMDDYEQ